MKPFQAHGGKVAVLDRVNVDTDQIIPKQFLKRIERTGFGQFLFFDWRFESDGETLQPSFELNRPEVQGASILLAGTNFGCGSSREHAPWALLDYGFRVIIAPSFADIFYNNCFKNGILPIALTGDAYATLLGRSKELIPYRLEVDLASQKILGEDGFQCSFDVDPFRKKCLLEGLDDIGITLQSEDAIATFERKMSPSFLSSGKGLNEPGKVQVGEKIGQMEPQGE